MELSEKKQLVQLQKMLDEVDVIAKVVSSDSKIIKYCGTQPTCDNCIFKRNIEKGWKCQVEAIRELFTVNENYYEQQREIICEEMNRVNPDYKATDYEDLEKEIENV